MAQTIGISSVTIKQNEKKQTLFLAVKLIPLSQWGCTLASVLKWLEPPVRGKHPKVVQRL